jgi:3-hydroxymyristoyl/3-hydroxydecanoyl-(acyl carrier protein) dehydratase
MKKIEKKELAEMLQITDPFLLIDYAYDVNPGYSASSQKELRNDDWFFECHLKKEQAMPGTLQTEAMLQTLVLCIYTLIEHKGKIALVTDIKLKLFKKVSPNSILKIETNIISMKRGMIVGTGKGFVKDQIVCKGEFNLILPDLIPRIIK